jgi:REP element-mobilizing transposase RayT
MSRTALPGLPIKDAEKDYFLKLLKHLSKVYFAEVMGVCCMGTHFHVVLRMHPGTKYKDSEVVSRFKRYYGKDKVIGKDQIPFFREKWEKLAEFMKELKQVFTRYYNKRHDRRGYFWGDRFKSLIVEDGETLINCLAYIDLNPVRAGIVEKPEEYRWNSIGYHVQTNNEGSFLSLDFGLVEFGVKSKKERLRLYRKFVYETGALDKGKGAKISEGTLKKEQDKDFELSRVDRFKYRSRYFCDSGIIGTKEFVHYNFQLLQHCFSTKKDRVPVKITGLKGIYSLKRLTE